jgi:hypothetical protein
VENYYDHAARRWVTSGDRYQAVADQPRFAALSDWSLWDQPAKQWPLILDLLAAVPEDTVGCVGAGPLETFINGHADTFVEQLEAELPRNERLRRAVIEVNLEEGRFPPDIEARLLAAFGPRFRLLPPSA